MQTIALDINNDWTCYQVKKDVYAIEQSLNTRLRMIKNDWFLGLDDGLSMSNFNNGMQKMLISEIKDIIINTDGIVKIINLESDINNITRQLTINYIVQTIYSYNITNNIII